MRRLSSDCWRRSTSAPSCCWAARPPARRRRCGSGLPSGQARLVVGTHALMQESVAFQRLGLVVIDEQHRFGVEQRAALIGKGAAPDVLLLTATPIPRSLALTLYGDLDVSTLRTAASGSRLGAHRGPHLGPAGAGAGIRAERVPREASGVHRSARDRGVGAGGPPGRDDDGADPRGALARAARSAWCTAGSRPRSGTR